MNGTRAPATFRIATFVNDGALYAHMRASFEAAGFTDPVACYTVEDGEPYSGITRLATAPEPYVLLVHQDVECDQGHCASDLIACLERLSSDHPQWGICGNAGYTRRGEPVMHLTDTQLSDPVRAQSGDDGHLIERGDMGACNTTTP